MEVMMSKKRPTKKAFYEYMSLKYKRKYKDEEGYMTLLDIVSRASKDDAVMMEMAELTLMTRADRMIYRNAMAIGGIEMTPTQVDEYLSIIEYGLEYIDT